MYYGIISNNTMASVIVLLLPYLVNNRRRVESRFTNEFLRDTVSETLVIGVEANRDQNTIGTLHKRVAKLINDCSGFIAESLRREK